MIAAFVHSLNIGIPQREIFSGKEIITGICKNPRTGAVALSKTGFTGDGVHNKKHHGGEDKAICFYGLDHYEFWTRELGFSLPAGAFGENITLAGYTEDDVCIGDVFKLGTATIEISQPRQPCKVLAARYDRPDLVKMVVSTGYTGWYCRVLVEGYVCKGDSMSLLKKGPKNLSISFANNIFHHDRKNRRGLEQILSLTALSDSWKKSFHELLESCP